MYTHPIPLVPGRAYTKAPAQSRESGAVVGQHLEGIRRVWSIWTLPSS